MNIKTSIKQIGVRIRKSLLTNNNPLLMQYYQRIWRPKPNRLEAFLDDFAKGKPDFFFMQVGGNDGFQNDLICKFVKRYRWNGITIEPQKAPFETLQLIYQNDGVIPVNVAIDKEATTRKLYKVAFTNARWASGISSFLKSHLEEKIANGYIEKKAKKTGIELPENQSDWITYDEVKCVPFSELIEEHKIHKIDLLQIDTEGFDYEILKLFKFDTILPKAIIFESENLSKEDLAECKLWLGEKGYQFQTFGGDTLGVL